MSVHARARELLPQVLLTLLSLIQALALELLWNNMIEAEYLTGGGVRAVAGWLQFASIVVGILLVWLLYTSMVIRFTWVPKTRDSIFPFAIGMLEFALIETSGPGSLATWLCLMAVVFGVSTYASNDIYVRVLNELEEPGAVEGFFRGSDLWVAIGSVGAILVLAIVASLAGGYGGFAVFAFALIIAMLLVQTWLVHTYTRDALRTAGAEGTEQDDEP